MSAPAENARSRSGEYNGVNAVVVFKLGHGGVDFAVKLLTQRVENLWPVELNYAYIVLSYKE